MLNFGNTAVLFIVGIFFIWKGSIKVSRKSEAWPASKKNGRILGGIMLIPLILILIFTSPFSTLKPGYESVPAGTTYVNSQYGFNMTFPISLIADERQTKGEVVQFFDRSQDVQLIIAVNSINEQGINISNFDTYVDSAVQQIKNEPGSVIIDNKKLDSRTIPMYLTEHKLIINKKLIHFMQLILLAKDGQIFIVSGMCEDSLWPQFGDTIKSSLLSFSFK